MSTIATVSSVRLSLVVAAAESAAAPSLLTVRACPPHAGTAMATQRSTSIVEYELRFIEVSLSKASRHSRQVLARPPRAQKSPHARLERMPAND
jgi:hypothetical protein